MTLPLAALSMAAPVAKGLVDAVGDIGKALGKGSAPKTPQTLEERLAALPKSQADHIRKTAQDFEAVFLETMFAPMFDGAGEEGPLGENGTGGATWRSMLTNEYARTFAKSGGVGIAEPVMAEMLRLQESAGA